MIDARTEKAAKEGDSDAQFQLGNFFHSKSVTSQVRARNGDAEKAFEWYLKAANQGHANAQYRLALAYDEGVGVCADRVQYAYWLHKSASLGNAWAQFRLGLFYKNYFGGEANLEVAAGWFKKAADQGLSEARLFLQASTIQSQQEERGVAVNATTTQANLVASAIGDIAAGLRPFKDNPNRTVKGVVGLWKMARGFPLGKTEEQVNSSQEAAIALMFENLMMDDAVVKRLEVISNASGGPTLQQRAIKALQIFILLGNPKANQSDLLKMAETLGIPMPKEAVDAAIEHHRGASLVKPPVILPVAAQVQNKSSPVKHIFSSVVKTVQAIFVAIVLMIFLYILHRLLPGTDYGFWHP